MCAWQAAVLNQSRKTMRLPRALALFGGLGLSSGSFQCWHVVTEHASGATRRPGTFASAAVRMQVFDERPSFMGSTAAGMEGDDMGVGTAQQQQQQQQRWDDSSFDNLADNSAPAVVPSPPPPRRPIETVNVGVVGGPYKRRRGYHVEVAVQHDGGAFETLHRLWFGHEVLSDVAGLRGRYGEDIDVNQFSEALLTFLQGKGVDLSDPDWGMADDSIPFSTEHLPLRTLFDYYGMELPEYLAEETLRDWKVEIEPVEVGNLGRGITLLEAVEGPFPCLGALPNPGEESPPLDVVV